MSVQVRLMIAIVALLSLGTTAAVQQAPSSSTSASMPGMAMQDMPGMDMSPTKPARKAAPAKHHHPASTSAAMKSEGTTSRHIRNDQVVSMSASQAPNDHVPPPAPQHPLAPMSPAQMTDMMQMNDQAARGMWLVDQLEHRDGADGDGSTAWNAEGWWGDDLDKLWLKTEGERDRDRDGTQDASADLLWSHAVSTFWDWQLGVRHDFGQGPTREWVAAGVQGLAAYWFEVAATLYAGPQGRTAARLEASYDLLLTQRLILSPELELNFYGKDDPQRDVRSGLSEAEGGLRLRYEFSRRFAPYLGIDRTRHFGRFVDKPGDYPARGTTFVAGVRFWF